jgi:hypothetical protein
MKPGFINETWFQKKTYLTLTRVLEHKYPKIKKVLDFRKQNKKIILSVYDTGRRLAGQITQPHAFVDAVVWFAIGLCR